MKTSTLVLIGGAGALAYLVWKKSAKAAPASVLPAASATSATSRTMTPAERRQTSPAVGPQSEVVGPSPFDFDRFPVF